MGQDEVLLNGYFYKIFALGVQRLFHSCKLFIVTTNLPSNYDNKEKINGIN